MLQDNSAVDIPSKNNFDLLRLALALNVFLCHLGEVSWVKTFFPLNRIFNSTLAVDCFFVVSGFLIFRSFHRSSSTLSYLDKRVRRIYPAYVAAVLIGAFLLPRMLKEDKSVIIAGAVTAVALTAMTLQFGQALYAQLILIVAFIIILKVRGKRTAEAGKV